MSLSSPPPFTTPGDRLALAIDRHVTATSTTLARVLATAVASFDEPGPRDPARALHHLSYLIETLLGVAAGGVIGRVVSAVLRGLGPDAGFAFEIPLRDALRRVGPGNRRRVITLTPAAAFLQDAAARPLVDELGARLYPRLAHAGRDHRAILTQLAAAIPAARAEGFASTLAALDDDPMLASLWSEHLQVAWRHYAVAGVADSEPELPPELAGVPACETWRAWLRRVRGEAPPPEPRNGEYITAIVA